LGLSHTVGGYISQGKEGLVIKKTILILLLLFTLGFLCIPSADRGHVEVQNLSGDFIPRLTINICNKYKKEFFDLLPGVSLIFDHKCNCEGHYEVIVSDDRATVALASNCSYITPGVSLSTKIVVSDNEIGCDSYYGVD